MSRLVRFPAHLVQMRPCSSPVIRQLSSAASTASHGPAGLCGPAVRLLIHQYGIDDKEVLATGPKKNILKSDVLSLINARGLKPLTFEAAPPQDPKSAFLSPSKPPPSPAGSKRSVEMYVDIPLTNIRATIAKRLTQSKQTVPHAYQSMTVRSDAVLALRRQLKNDGITVSLNDFIVKACGLALRSVPAVNIQWNAAQEQVASLNSVDISVAVATPTGLITPIVKSADFIGVRQISRKIKELADKAREGKLRLDEFQGGSFTISNLGMFGSVDNFTAIINPPQAAILTVGGNRLVLNDELEPENRFTLTLCYDGRAISESSAMSFLSHVSASLSDPEFMIGEPIDPALDFDFSRLL